MNHASGPLYIITRTTAPSIRGQTLSLKAGQFLTDIGIINALLEGGCDAIQKLDRPYQLVPCQRCNHNNVVFDRVVEQPVIDKPAEVISIKTKSKIAAG